MFIGSLAASLPSDPRLADAHDRIRDAERRVTEIDSELATLDGDLVDEREVAAALADFDAVWDCLAPREQSRVIELLIECVNYDGESICITFLPSGIKTLARELAERKENAAWLLSNARCISGKGDELGRNCGKVMLSRRLLAAECRE